MSQDAEQEFNELERQCVQKAQAGDESAFATLVERYLGRVYNICYSFVNNHHDAEDCVQESFLKAYRYLPNFDFRSSFYTWLYRIAANTCIDLQRKRTRQRALSLDDTMKTNEGELQFQLADPSPGPDTEAEKKQFRQMIRQEIDKLPRALRQIIILKDLAELSYQEIGQMLGLAPGTVKSRIFRGRQQLFKNMAQREK